MYARCFNGPSFRWLVVSWGLALGASQGCSTPRTEPATASGGADGRDTPQAQQQEQEVYAHPPTAAPASAGPQPELAPEAMAAEEEADMLEDSASGGAAAPSPGRAVTARKSKIAGDRVITLDSMPAPPVDPSWRQGGPFNTEAYDSVQEQDFKRVAHAPLSTFSVDVDTASYSNVRRFLTHGALPPTGAVRIEELVNYFSYAYPQPQGDAPFSVTSELSEAPWNPDHHLLHVGLQGKKLRLEQVPARNLVFLIDVSGSMQDSNKLPLLKRSFSALVETLRPKDKVSMVVYAGASGVVLAPTAGNQKQRILSALNQLEAGGSTNGAQGLQLAYQLAKQHMQPGGVNRVLLATDGDFNVGITSRSELVRMIEHYRESGVSLTTLGFGMGNYKDGTMEQLANKGNGNYAYIDTLSEARKVLVEEGGATLVTIAKDVKIQVEFNPAKVGAYRLIGYDNRRLNDQDFNDDKKDAGEIGAGHTVTALYEIVPAGREGNLPRVDPLRYGGGRWQAPKAASSDEALASKAQSASPNQEWLTIKLRYKKPQGAKSTLMVRHVSGKPRRLAQASTDFRFSAAVAAFGLVLRDSKYRGSANFALARRLARGATSRDPNGYRQEFLSLVDRASAMASR